LAAAGALGLVVSAEVDLVIGRDPTLVWERTCHPRPLRAASFECDQWVARKLSRIAGSELVAQTDYQRLKYFADELHVLDVSGLNHRDIARRPVEAPVLWGKFDPLDTILRSPAIWVLGHHVYVHDDAMSDYPLLDVLGEAELHDRFFGYGLAPQFIEPVSRTYATASVPVCGGYFNVLVRRDFAEKARERGALIGL